MSRLVLDHDKKHFETTSPPDYTQAVASKLEHTWPLKACSSAPFLKARMRGLKRKKLVVCFNKEVKK